MSATNWATCHNCKNKKAALLLKMAANYGKLPFKEFMELKDEAEEHPDHNFESLREDYHIGVDNNNSFYVVYSCGCDNCGFSFEYKYSEKVEHEAI